MSIIMKYNDFYVNGNFLHQTKGTAIGTHATVLCVNLICEYLEVKLPEIFSYAIVEFFLNNYFRFVDDVKHTWKESIDVSPL